MSTKPYHNGAGFNSVRTPLSKNNASSQATSNSNSTNTQGLGSPKNKTGYQLHPAPVDPDQFNNIHKENTFLREENRVLRR